MLLSHSFHLSSFPASRFHTSSLLFSSTRNDLEQHTVVRLKEQLRTLGLKVSGRKIELIDRLLEHDSDFKMPRSTKGRKQAQRKEQEKEETETEEVESSRRSPRKRTRKVEESDAREETKKSPAKKKKAADHQRITAIDEIPKLWDSEKALKDGSYSECRIFGE